MAYSVGETVNGVVSGVTDYGAFVKLAEGEVGMIHISKLSDAYIADIHGFIKKGDPVTATVISNGDGKIALSLIGNVRDEPFKLRKSKPPKDFEEMLSSFKSVSDEKIAGMNSRNKRKRR